MSSVEVTIQDSSQLDNLSDQVIESITDLIFESECCDDLTTLNLSGFRKLKTLEIEIDGLENAGVFVADGLSELQSVKIGMNAFNPSFGGDDDLTEDKMNNTNHYFQLSNCAKLESIEIQGWSFSDCAGGFLLDNLPKLTTIKIGDIGSSSLNFLCSSFVIKGLINVILIMNRFS